jgi:hypothetical protein
MAQKIYKSAMGHVVDLGALMLQNENVRAVGNMGVNARGDTVDNTNRVVESRNKQVQKHYRRQVTATANTADTVPTSSTVAAKKQKSTRAKVTKEAVVPVANKTVIENPVIESLPAETIADENITIPEPVPADELPEIESLEELAELEVAVPELTQDSIKSVPRGGLAAAIAKAQTVKQELLKTPRQLAQAKPGVNKI